MKRSLFRIIDANLNRSREGLRVCEDIARFLLNDRKLTREFKNIRHQVSRNIEKFPAKNNLLLKSRNSREDVGKDAPILRPRKNCQDVFSANSQRVKESLRVLEELSGVFDRVLSKNFAKLRFRVYQLEQKAIARFQALCNS